MSFKVDKDLRLILKDGKFSKLPARAKVMGREIVSDTNKRFGYLTFESTPSEIQKWIVKSKLTLTSTKEIFEKNIIVWTTNKPKWFSESSGKLGAGKIYYSKRNTGNFTTLCYVDSSNKIIHLEYEISR